MSSYDPIKMNICTFFVAKEQLFHYIICQFSYSFPRNNLKYACTYTKTLK